MQIFQLLYVQNQLIQKYHLAINKVNKKNSWVYQLENASKLNFSANRIVTSGQNCQYESELKVDSFFSHLHFILPASVYIIKDIFLTVVWAIVKQITYSL